MFLFLCSVLGFLVDFLFYLTILIVFHRVGISAGEDCVPEETTSQVDVAIKDNYIVVEGRYKTFANSCSNGEQRRVLCNHADNQIIVWTLNNTVYL